MQVVNFTTLTLGDNTSECIDSGAEGEHKRALMVARNQTKHKPKTLNKE